MKKEVSGKGVKLRNTEDIQTIKLKGEMDYDLFAYCKPLQNAKNREKDM